MGQNRLLADKAMSRWGDKEEKAVDLGKSRQTQHINIRSLTLNPKPPNRHASLIPMLTSPKALPSDGVSKSLGYYPKARKFRQGGKMGVKQGHLGPGKNFRLFGGPRLSFKRRKALMVFPQAQAPEAVLVQPDQPRKTVGL